MWRLIVIALLAVTGAGCQREKPPLCVVVYNVHEYYIHFEAAALSQACEDSVTGGSTEPVFSVVGGTNHLQIEGGRMKLNGRPRGTVNPGDKIEVSASGELRVNGQPRGE